MRTYPIKECKCKYCGNSMMGVKRKVCTSCKSENAIRRLTIKNDRTTTT